MAAINPAAAGGLKIWTFLDLIAYSEGTSRSPITRDRGYDVIVSSVEGPSIFSGYEQHPFTNRKPLVIRRVPLLLSTASGRYQINLPTWRRLRASLCLPDFSPESQDLAALELLRETKANVLLLAGDVKGAIQAVSHIWASFPGNNYGQGGLSRDAELAEFAVLQAEQQAETA